MPGLDPHQPRPSWRWILVIAVGLLAALVLAAIVVITIFGSGAGL
jgi:hypothetical protein